MNVPKPRLKLALAAVATLTALAPTQSTLACSRAGPVSAFLRADGFR